MEFVTECLSDWNASYREETFSHGQHFSRYAKLSIPFKQDFLKKIKCLHFWEKNRIKTLVDDQIQNLINWTKQDQMLYKKVWIFRRYYAIKNEFSQSIFHWFFWIIFVAFSNSSQCLSPDKFHCTAVQSSQVCTRILWCGGRALHCNTHKSPHIGRRSNPVGMAVSSRCPPTLVYTCRSRWQKSIRHWLGMSTYLGNQPHRGLGDMFHCI